VPAGVVLCGYELVIQANGKIGALADVPVALNKYMSPTQDLWFAIPIAAATFRRKITDLPPPYATRSASNPPRVIAKPASATPKVPPGFEVELFVSNLHDPRTVRVAPNGDIFIAESEPGRVRVLRAADGAANQARSPRLSGACAIFPPSD
jgi:glucose/arabinose dehydrogenase